MGSELSQGPNLGPTHYAGLTSASPPFILLSPTCGFTTRYYLSLLCTFKVFFTQPLKFIGGFMLFTFGTVSSQL